MEISGLVPARFLTLTAHLIITTTVLWSREENVKAGLPLKYSPEDYEDKDIELVVALSLTLCFCVIEYVGFFGGFSTFSTTPSLISACLHSAACVAMAFFIWDVWDCSLYWFIFVFTSAIPALFEVVIIASLCILKKV